MDENTPAVGSPIYYVGIGASAGGLEALEAFFNNMTADSGMAFIVIQHLSPDYKSLMVELLSKRTEMPVHRAENGMLVEPNSVYLIPPKKNLTIFHGKLLLIDPDLHKGVNLPIDIFLSSLADDQADKSVGIILSGTGSDGVRGIRAIKEMGGMIMVQSQESAKFDGMPRSAISTGLADIVLPIEQIPARLLLFARHMSISIAETPQNLLSDEDGLTRIFALLRERTKVDFTYYKPSTVLRRIERRMTVNQVSDLREYVRLMENHSGEVMVLYRELLIGVTSFFRDRDVFDELEKIYIPEILSRSANREIRIWVAGCSTGEEAYSLAILCRECMEQTGTHVDVKIFATDIDRDAIMRAGVGTYPESITADLPPRILAKYFRPQDDRYRIDRSIREMVVFAQHNLIKDPPFTNIDLVSCRNLMIYLQPVLQRQVLDLINFSLTPQGILLLGTSETTGEMGDYFEALHHKHKIFRSKGKRRIAVDGPDYSMTADIQPRIPRPRFSTGGQVLRAHEEERVLDRLLQTMAGDLFPLAIVVNEQGEVQHIIGDTEGYFHLPSGKLSNEISRLAVKDLAIPISTGLQKVFKTGEEMRYTNIRLHNKGESHFIHMRIKPLSGKRNQEPLAVIFVEEAATPISRELGAGDLGVYDVSQETEQHLHDLEQELQFTRENLQATIEELETSNEELQATNEELLASNEELQSTNEELHSVNEELHTVNAEYQSKILELTELNNDLDNLIAGTQVGLLFLDENLEIRKFTPEIKKIFKILDSDIGRPIHHLSHQLAKADPMELIREVERSNIGKNQEVLTNDGEWFLMRILPYTIGAGAVSGIVLMFIDIQQLKETQQALFESNNRLSSLLSAAPVGIGLIANRTLLEVNDTLCRMVGYEREELVGKNISLLYVDQNEYLRAGTDLYQQVLETGVGLFETRWKHKNGSLVPVLISTAPVNPATVEDSLTIVVQDNTKIQHAIQHAHQSQESYRQLFNTMTEGVVYQNASGEITSANPAARRILGLAVDEITGRTSSDIRWQAIRIDGTDFPGDQHPSMVALKSGKVVRGAVMGIHNPQDGSVHWIRINAVPLFAPGEAHPVQVYTTFDDITFEIEIQRQAAEAQQRLDTALSVAGFAWWDWNVVTGEVQASPQKAQWIGFQPDEIEPALDFWLSRLHPDDYERAMSAMRDCMYGTSPLYQVDYRLRTRQDEWIWLRDTGRLVQRSSEGEPLRLIGTVQPCAGTILPETKTALK